MGPPLLDRVVKACEFIEQSLPQELLRPPIGIICGSGLSGLSQAVRSKLQIRLAYSEVPHFPTSTVVGHPGYLLFGFLANGLRPVVLMVGRAQSVALRCTGRIKFSSVLQHPATMKATRCKTLRFPSEYSAGWVWTH
ncbi:MAG: hypothetical protein Q9217_006888 [Psora testacea]